jgi:hypothetical protein
MCTVTYIPLKDRVLFSSNRDENPRRKPALAPKSVQGENHELFYPADGAAGGSWIGLNNSGNLIIVLNGGFIDHARKAQYRKSRGLIMTGLLDSQHILEDWNLLDLEDIEPFTIIAYIHQKLHQLVWTGFEKSHLLPDPLLPHIWSSSTLYNTQAKEQRRQWFQHFTQTQPTPTGLELLQYLLYDAPQDYYNGFNMNRNELVKTCSISVVDIQNHTAGFLYHDVILADTITTSFSFAKQHVEANQ